MSKFKNKYRNESFRLQSWDYGSEGMYFITICTKDRDHFFGEIRKGEMILNEIGLVAQSEWLLAPSIRPDMNLELGEFVVMPDHFHGIIIIGDNIFNNINFTAGGFDTNGGDINERYWDAGWDAGWDASWDAGWDASWDASWDAMHGVPTTPLPIEPSPTTPSNQSEKPRNQFGPQSKNLASIIRGFKSAVTTHARKNNIPFGWQGLYHDHIIRSHGEYLRISNYIRNNPANWGKKKILKKKSKTV